MPISIFPETWYFPVPVKRCESFMYWHNTSLIDELNELTYEFYKLFGINDKISNHNIGIVTNIFSQSFVSQKDWETYTKSVKYLKSERFFDPYSIDVGSGRNVIFQNGAWKGVGRNHAATRIDYAHCSGSMTLSESIFEVFIDKVFQKFDNSAHVPIMGAFSYRDYDSSFIVRSSDVVRCGQIVESMKLQEKEAVLNYLKTKLPNISKSEWLKFSMDRITRLLKKGVFQTSPSRDNLCLDGRMLDNRTIDWISGYDELKFSFILYFKSPLLTKDDFIKGLEWKKIYTFKLRNIATPVNFLSAKFHNLKAAYKILDIPGPDWDDLIDEYSSFLNLPKCFFFSEENHIQSKVKASYNLLLEAETLGAKIKTYYISSDTVLISIGSSLNIEVVKTILKLLKVNFLANNSLKHSHHSELLNKLLINYDFEP